MGLSPWYLTPRRVNLVRVMESGHGGEIVVVFAPRRPGERSSVQLLVDPNHARND